MEEDNKNISISITTGKPSQKGKRLKSKDGLTWKQRNKDAVNSRRRYLYAENPEKERNRQKIYRKSSANTKILASNRAWQKSYRDRIREEMIYEYG